MRSVKEIYPTVRQQSELFEAFQQHILFIKNMLSEKLLIRTEHGKG
jgi:hypothetical protein